MRKIIFCLFGLIVAACAATNLAPQNIHLGQTNYLKTISAQEGMKDGKIVVNISGEAYEDTTYYYRVVWFDASGIAMDTILSRPVMAKIRRDSPFNWVAIAPNSKATSYQVYVSDRPIEQ